MSTIKAFESITGVCALSGFAACTLSLCSIAKLKQNKICDEFLHKYWVLSGRLQNWPRLSNYLQRNVENSIARDLFWTSRLVKISKVTALVGLIFGVIVIAIHSYSETDNSSGARKRK